MFMSSMFMVKKKKFFYYHYCTIIMVFIYFSIYSVSHTTIHKHIYIFFCTTVFSFSIFISCAYEEILDTFAFDNKHWEVSKSKPSQEQFFFPMRMELVEVYIV